MRKVLFILFLYIFLIAFDVNAITNNNDYVITDGGAHLSISDYNQLKELYNDELINQFDNDRAQFHLNNKTKFEEKYIITTYYYNIRGEEIAQYDMEGTREQALLVRGNNNFIVNSVGKLVQNRDLYWSTSVTTSKQLNGAYYYDSYESSNNKYKIEMYVSWYSMPKIKKHDVFAARWDYYNFVDSFYGHQISNTGTTYYNESTSPNVKSESNGFGVTMNLHNNATTQLDLMYLAKSNSSFGSTVYGTYQHAKNSNITMNSSLSYTFSSSGLGGVLYYSNATISGYYDGMSGIVMSYQSV